jgi:hypothetical protein
MALEDTLARLAPREVDGLHVQWDIDSGTDWIEVTGWFSPGWKLGSDNYEMSFKSRGSASEAGITGCVGLVIDAMRSCLNPPIAEPVKRPRGRPRKAA